MAPAASSSPAPLRPGRWAHRGRVVERLAHMLLAGLEALAVGLATAATRGGPGRLARAGGRAYVHLATRLGATFIKVGQITSTRRDLLPPAAIEELRRLQDRVPAFDFATVRALLQAELGRPLEEVFAEFEPTPVAAASVAQVHRARLREGGAVVAVKVRRPDLLEKVRLDRSILLRIARLLQRLVPTLRLVALEEAMRAFCDAVEEQVHLRLEAENNRRFRRNFADDTDVVFPALHEAVCTDAVLTMAFIDGVQEDDLETAGVDVERVVEAGMRCVSRMIFLHGFVHADLHPGNLRFLAPGRIALFDLGLVGRIEDTDRLTLARLLFALATGDGATVARLFYENAPFTATPDYAAYEREICAFVEDVRRKGLDNVQLTLEIGRIFDILRRHHVQARAHMTMVNLALMTAEGLGKRLAPGLSLTDEALPYLAEALGIPVPPPARVAG